LAEVKNKTPEKLKQIKPCKNKNLEVLVVVKRKKSELFGNNRRDVSMLHRQM